MSNFTCEHCNTDLIDSPYGYITGCEHYPADIHFDGEPNSGFSGYSIGTYELAWYFDFELSTCRRYVWFRVNEETKDYEYITHVDEVRKPPEACAILFNWIERASAWAQKTYGDNEHLTDDGLLLINHILRPEAK